MMLRKTIFSMIKMVSALSVVGLSLPSFADLKIGVVNVRRVVFECNEGKAVKEKLEKFATGKRKELEKLEGEFAKEVADYQKQAAVLTAEAQQKRAAELQKKREQGIELGTKIQQDVAKEEERLLKPLQEKVGKAIQSLGSDGKFSMILHKDAVLWPDEFANDLTNEVIRKLNAAK